MNFHILRKPFRENIDLLNLYDLSTNETAVYFLEENPQYINWRRLQQNKNPYAINIFENNPSKIYGIFFSNPNFISLIRKNIDKINWKYLSANENAMDILENNIDKIDYEMLSSNNSATLLLLKNHEKINIFNLYDNKNIAQFLEYFIENNVRFIDETHNVNENILLHECDISLSTYAIPFLEKNLHYIDWWGLSNNKKAIHILEKNIDKVDWRELSANENAIHILEKNMDKIGWRALSYNEKAIHILEKNIDKVDWRALSYNKNAIHIIEKYPEKINWPGLSRNENAAALFEKYLTREIMIENKMFSEFELNPCIFTYDYDKIKNAKQDINEKIHKLFLHPKIIAAYLEDENNSIDDIDENINMFVLENIHLISALQIKLKNNL